MEQVPGCRHLLKIGMNIENKIFDLLSYLISETKMAQVYNTFDLLEDASSQSQSTAKTKKKHKKKSVSSIDIDDIHIRVTPASDIEYDLLNQGEFQLVSRGSSKSRSSENLSMKRSPSLDRNVHAIWSDIEMAASTSGDARSKVLDAWIDKVWVELMQGVYKQTLRALFTGFK